MNLRTAQEMQFADAHFLMHKHAPKLDLLQWVQNANWAKVAAAAAATATAAAAKAVGKEAVSSSWGSKSVCGECWKRSDVAGGKNKKLSQKQNEGEWQADRLKKCGKVEISVN